MRIGLVDARRHEQVLLVLHLGRVVLVLSRICRFVLQDLDEFVEACSDDGAEDRTEPVDPVVGLEAGVDDCRAEGACWIKTAAGEIDASEFGDEKR